MREVNGGASDESARTSLKRGASPSRFAVLEMGRDSKLAAKERAAAMERSPDHRVAKAAIQIKEAKTRASSRACEQHLFDRSGLEDVRSGFRIMTMTAEQRK